MAEKNRTTNLPKDHIQSANTIDKYFSSISPSETATRKEKTASSKQTNTAGDFYSKLLSKQLLERKRKDRDDDNSVSDISEVSENEDADSDHGKCNDVGCMNQVLVLKLIASVSYFFYSFFKFSSIDRGAGKRKFEIAQRTERDAKKISNSSAIGCFEGFTHSNTGKHLTTWQRAVQCPRFTCGTI